MLEIYCSDIPKKHPYYFEDLGSTKTQLVDSYNPMLNIFGSKVWGLSLENDFNLGIEGCSGIKLVENGKVELVSSSEKMIDEDDKVGEICVLYSVGEEYSRKLIDANP